MNYYFDQMKSLLDKIYFFKKRQNEKDFYSGRWKKRDSIGLTFLVILIVISLLSEEKRNSKAESYTVNLSHQHISFVKVEFKKIDTEYVNRNIELEKSDWEKLSNYIGKASHYPQYHGIFPKYDTNQALIRIILKDGTEKVFRVGFNNGYVKYLSFRETEGNRTWYAKTVKHDSTYDMIFELL